METPDCTNITRLLEAFDDNELDAVTSFAVQEHLEICPHCRARHAWAREVRASLGRVRSTDPAAPSALHARIHRELEGWRWRRRLTQTAAVAAALIVAGLLAFQWMTRPTAANVPMEFVRNHHASLQRPDAVKFSSADVGAVEAWLREQLPFAVTIPGRSPSGYQLAGARLCEVAGNKVGYLLYSASGQPPVSLFVSRRDAYDLRELPMAATEQEIKIRCGECDGTTVAAWDAGEVTYVAAGDIAETSMLAFAHQFDSIQ
ncbi:MAG TPA: zf-HC2 domain-containing protein [Opitutaceae bacterium]